MSNTKEATINLAFWLHLLLVVIAWTGPFLISWQLMLAIYTIVQLQFGILGKCVVNRHHDLDDEGSNYTFYAFLFELMGFNPDRVKVRFLVRRVSNWFLAGVTILWQLILGFQAILF